MSWERPVDFNFTAGQSIDVTLLDMPTLDRYGATRSFSIASAPSEDEILVAMRIRNSAFKKRLAGFPTEQHIEWDGPFGGMILPKDETIPLVCLAGGIGITPFRSMIREITRQRTNLQLTLLYSNATREDAAFLSELLETASAFPAIRIVPTYTKLQGANTVLDHIGRINAKFIKENISDLNKNKFYIAGPVRFTSAMKQILVDVGIARTSILNEVFDGY